MAKADPLETAYHEAAHAVFHLKLGLRQGRVTIRPDESQGTLGHSEFRRPKWINDSPATTREEQRLRLNAENEILSLLAGRIAQSKYAGRRIRWGHEFDYQTVTDLAFSFISYDPDIQHAFLAYCEKQAQANVDHWWPEIQAVAHALTERTTLTRREIEDVIAAIPLEVLEQHYERRRQADDAAQAALKSEPRLDLRRKVAKI
jgi:hypothetical protein